MLPEITFPPSEDLGPFRYRGTHIWDLKCPKESYKERFQRYVAWRKSKQPAGLLEVTTHDYPYSLGGNKETTQTDWWREELEKTGFKAVTSFLNSNTRRTITVWHYAYNTEDTKEREA